MRLVTLTTDFGTRDGFVGTMKGVILGLAPRATIIDLTHEIPPGDIRAGALVLTASCRFFPKSTVHVAVVDPGVGSARKAIAVQTANYFFIGPDNGLLSWALAKERIKAIHVLENDRLEAEESFHRSMDESPLGIRIVTPEGKAVYANQAILDIFGYSSVEELKITPKKNLYTPESYAGAPVEEKRRGSVVSTSHPTMK